MSFLTFNAIKYTLSHLFKVAGIILSDSNTISVNEDGLLLIIKFPAKSITFNISTPKDIQELLNGTLQLNHIATADNEHVIPIILKQGLPFAEIEGEVLKVNADVISLSFIMLSRYEETIIEERDAFGRFEFKNSIAAKYNFIDFPIVDEYALILKSFLLLFLPEFELITYKSRVIPTHDIDEIFRFSGLKKTFRTISGDIYIYKNIIKALTSIYYLIKTIWNSKFDPYIISIHKLIDLSKNFGLKSEFYFMGANPSEYDCGYNLNSKIIVDIFNKIEINNMIVGFHGGFYTFKNPDLMQQEKNNIESIYKRQITFCRQHYLRIDVSSSFEVMEKVGLQYDSSLGYAEREGFRCGTCHEYRIYDVKNDTQYSIIVRPLILMDVTLSGYRRLSMNNSLLVMNNLLKRCEFVGGNFIFLWHNRTVDRDPLWFRKVYNKFLVTSCSKSRSNK